MIITRQNSKQFLSKTHFLYNIRKQSQTSSGYCLDSVKKYDYENFVCTLLLENTSRAVALAVRGFNVEVAKVAEQVSQPNIGKMRLKFWEETVEKCFSNDPSQVPQHPIAVELYKAISKRKLTKRYFMNLITSRVENINRTTFSSLEELEKYSEHSVSNIYFLLLEGSDIRNIHADHAASHLGKAQGIIQQLRSIPVAKQINFIGIPQDMLIKHNVSHEEIIRGKSSEKLSECSFEVASRAYQHLQKARNLLKDVPTQGRTALLPAVAVESYLDRLQKVQHDVFHPHLQSRAWSWLPKLWYKSIKNEY